MTAPKPYYALACHVGLVWHQWRWVDPPQSDEISPNPSGYYRCDWCGKVR